MKVAKCENGNSLNIIKKDGAREYYYLWLRDHCRCPSCYNQVTSQRKVNITDIPFEIKANDCEIDEDVLKIVWNDGHKSEYSLSFLDELTYDNYTKKLERNYILWNKNEVIHFSICHVNYSDIMDSDESVSKLMKSLLDFGIGFIEKVPSDLKATESAILKLSHIQHTLFGGMWQFSDAMDHSDTAYTTEELGPHTDNTYFTESAGLQVLHCISHNGTGGESILVDGFKVLQILQQDYPDTFSRLTTTSVAAEYLEPGYHYIHCEPIIKLHPVTKKPEQLRFNIHDRSALCLPKDEILQHYKDYKILASIVKNPDLVWRFKLNPGTVLIFDNFRILHGRTAYTGHRIMCGCYIGRSDFLSKARVLKLI